MSSIQWPHVARRYHNRQFQIQNISFTHNDLCAQQQFHSSCVAVSDHCSARQRSPLYQRTCFVLRTTQAVILSLHGHPPSHPASTPLCSILMIAHLTLHLLSFPHASSADLQPQASPNAGLCFYTQLPKSYWSVTQMWCSGP